MSLLGTLAKVAIGIAIAKGASSMMRKARTNPGTGGSFGGLRDALGSILSGNTQGSAPGQGGGLGGLFERLAGGAGGSRGGGLGELLGSLFGRKVDGGPALGGLAAKDAVPSNDRSFGEMLDSSFANQGEPDVAPTPEQNAIAGILLKAMIQAARSDGKVDEREKEKLLGHLGDVSREEMEFVQAQLAAPIDIQGLARQVPEGLQAQVYTMSLMAIDLDNDNETKYLQELATALGLDRNAINTIHKELNLAPLYS